MVRYEIFALSTVSFNAAALIRNKILKPKLFSYRRAIGAKGLVPGTRVAYKIFENVENNYMK